MRALTPRGGEFYFINRITPRDRKKKTEDDTTDNIDIYIYMKLKSDMDGVCYINNAALNNGSGANFTMQTSLVRSL